MGGIGAVLDIATGALAAQKYGMEVTGHNIANVNTNGYSRQTPVQEAKTPAELGGLLLGRGVDTSAITRVSDRFVESRLRQQKSGLASFEEMEKYVKVLESMFSESSETSLSTLLADFWNSWHDIANNPSGAAERIALYEQGLGIAEHFNKLDTEMLQLRTDLTNALGTGIQQINRIAAELGELNERIVRRGEGDKVANDYKDRQNTLISELAEYIDVKVFEQENGSLTVATVRGGILVQGSDGYELELVNGDRVKWNSSGGSTVDITDYITKGKLGGWLEMRDRALAEYQGDLDALAREFTWIVNQQHSQGVGLTAFSEVTGTYAASDPAAEVAAADTGAGLTFADKINAGVDDGFDLHLYDAGGDYVSTTTIDIDAATVLDDDDPLDDTDIVGQIDDIANISAAFTKDGKFEITAAGGFTFAFSNDSSNVLAALGINTFFAGSSAGNMAVNSKIASDKDFIAAGQIHDEDGDSVFTPGDNSNALAIADLQSTKTTISGATTTVEDFYRSTVTSLGIESASISRSQNFNRDMVNNLTGIRDSVSGVSLDEETANLLKFQHAYAAAAKLLRVSDEMLRTLLETK